ncbi:MAG: hypothetical protein IKN81_02215 [Oscillospiraceae bacterium]|nr:hypothetical protein [Oscillospiraceae bacterium]
MNAQERAIRRDGFRKMDFRQKLDYIFTYYKLPIFLGVVALVIVCSTVHRQITKKEAVLYTAFINVSVGDALEDTLTTQFVARSGESVRKNEVYLYRDLYLSDDASFVNHEYAYASRLKLLGAINAKKLDLVLMNREGYDILSQNGYLMDFPELLGGDASLRQRLAPYLTENTVILEDNAIEFNLNEAESYQAVTEDVVNAIEVSGLPAFQSAGFPDAVFLGVIANSARTEWALRYLDYLLDPL